MIQRSMQSAEHWSLAYKRYLGIIAVLLAVVTLAAGPVKATAGGETKSAGGLTVYLGVVPAEIVRGPEPHAAERHMHGGPPSGSHEHHIVVAVFDSTSNARIENTTVTARISGLGLSGPQVTLEPMKIANAVSYGTYVDLTPDLYTIKVTIRRPGSQPVTLDFKYDHRRP